LVPSPARLMIIFFRLLTESWDSRDPLYIHEHSPTLLTSALKMDEKCATEKSEKLPKSTRRKPPRTESTRTEQGCLRTGCWGEYICS
jgi:hypothetical protein